MRATRHNGSGIARLAAWGLVVAVALPASGQEGSVSTAPDGSILHRRLPAPAGAKASAPVFVYDPRRGGSLPAEMQRDGMVMPAPELSSEPAGDDEAVYGDDGLSAAGGGPAVPRIGFEDPKMPGDTDAGGPGSPTGAETLVDPRGSLGNAARPDRDTQKEGTLGYHAVFDPSIVPFKRNRSLDRVAADGTLRLSEGGVELVPVVGNHVTAGREVFWGSILVEAEPGQLVPLPSVSPDSRILSQETTPRTNVSFHKDGADNYYVQATTPGRFRLVFLMDAPSSYFTRALPPEVTTRQVPSRLRPRLPGPIQEAALGVATRLGLRPGLPIATTVNALVSHFRSFEPGEPPPDTGDTYADLALGGRGICRHRAYAFVITAQGLGIPARYVFNEAHVFVEVWVPGPDAGWLRADLGGGAERLEIHGSEDKVRHQAAGRDPFDQPEEYARQLGQGPNAGATEVVGLPPTRRAGPAAGAGGGDGIGVPATAGALLPPPVERVAVEGAAPTRTLLHIEETIVYRGSDVVVSGRVTDGRGKGVSSGRVQLLLMEGGRREVLGLLGMTGLGSDGRFVKTIRLPEDQAPGGYEVVAEYLGTGSFAPSRSP